MLIEQKSQIFVTFPKRANKQSLRILLYYLNGHPAFTGYRPTALFSSLLCLSLKGTIVLNLIDGRIILLSFTISKRTIPFSREFWFHCICLHFWVQRYEHSPWPTIQFTTNLNQNALFFSCIPRFLSIYDRLMSFLNNLGWGLLHR